MKFHLKKRTICPNRRKANARQLSHSNSKLRVGRIWGITRRTRCSDPNNPLKLKKLHQIEPEDVSCTSSQELNTTDWARDTISMCAGTTFKDFPHVKRCVNTTVRIAKRPSGFGNFIQLHQLICFFRRGNEQKLDCAPELTKKLRIHTSANNMNSVSSSKFRTNRLASSSHNC